MQACCYPNHASVSVRLYLDQYVMRVSNNYTSALFMPRGTMQCRYYNTLTGKITRTKETQSLVVIIES